MMSWVIRSPSCSQIRMSRARSRRSGVAAQHLVEQVGGAQDVAPGLLEEVEELAVARCEGQTRAPDTPPPNRPPPSERAPSPPAPPRRPPTGPAPAPGRPPRPPHPQLDGRDHPGHGPENAQQPHPHPPGEPGTQLGTPPPPEASQGAPAKRQEPGRTEKRGWPAPSGG